MYESKCVCADCFGETYLKQLVQDHAHAKAQCDYCEAEDVPLVALDEVAKVLHRVFDKFYRCTSNSDEVVHHGRTPRGSDLCSLISELIQDRDAQPDGPLVENLKHLLLERIARDHYWFEHFDRDDDFWFERIDPYDYFHGREWGELLGKLRYESRYCNPKLHEFLDRTFGSIASEQTSDGEGLITVVGPRQKISHVYRSRVFQDPDLLSQALKHPEKDLGPPPIGRASSGRMNAKGLSMFYGANLPGLAIAETRPPVGSYVLVGRFSFQRKLRLLNLSKLADIKIPEGLCLFEEETLRLYDRKAFLNKLETDLTMPAMPDTADDSYLVTQLISDYLATNEQLDLDGVIFRSTQLPGAGVEHLNFALFVKSSQVACSQESYKVQMDGHFDKHVFSGSRMREPDDEPFVSVTEGTYPPPAGPVFVSETCRTAVSSLVLERDSLSVMKVSEVQVKYRSVSVRSEVRRPSKE